MNLFKRLIVGEIGEAIDGIAWLSGAASKLVINQAVTTTRNRPHPWSSYAPYVTWDGLTDRTYLARHLPAAEVPVQPDPVQVRRLFQRPAGQGRLSRKSTCLFPAFAQYLTDGFLRTDLADRRRTTSNHEIDLCPLYGRTRAQTNALRLQSEAVGSRGLLKSRMIGAEEFPPFLYAADGSLADPAFTALDPPLVSPTLAPEKKAVLFAHGGDRANSTPFTSMMNTLFLREHNRIARHLNASRPSWDDERVFQTARNIVIPLFIKIVVEHYINHITPLPFGLRAEPDIAWDASWNRPNWMTVEFSLIYRWHSLLPDQVRWPGWGAGAIALPDFRQDNRPLVTVGLDAAFSLAAAQPAAELGAFNTGDDLLPIEDLAVLQARSNKVDTYNAYRAAFGLERATDFAEISSNPDVVNLLRDLYGHPDNVEFYPGLFAEDRTKDSPLPGLLMRMVAVDAFSQALTNPLLSEHVFNADTFTPWGLELILSTSKLGDILARNVPLRGATPIEMTQAGWRYGEA